MKNEIETSNIGKVFITVFVIIFGTTSLVYWFFDYEIALLYCISISSAMICMSLTGLENINILMRR
jgi:Na+/alanine symporter